jgi:hypothetical protein
MKKKYTRSMIIGSKSQKQKYGTDLFPQIHEIKMRILKK